MANKRCHQDHARTATEGRVIDGPMPVFGKIARIRASERDQAGILGPAQDAVAERGQDHVRKQTDEVHPEHRDQNGVPCFRCSRKRPMRSSVISPGLPQPIGWVSSDTIGMTSAAVPVRNASSALWMSNGVSISSSTS